MIVGDPYIFWNVGVCIRSIEFKAFGSVESHHSTVSFHDDVIKWKHFPRYWPFVRGIHRGIHRSPVNSPHRGQWCGTLMFSLICALNKRLSKQSWGWCFEAPSRSLWRHCNVRQLLVPTINNPMPLYSLRPRDAYIRQEAKPSVIQIMVCRRFGAKPLSGPMMILIQSKLNK